MNVNGNYPHQMATPPSFGPIHSYTPQNPALNGYYSPSNASMPFAQQLYPTLQQRSGSNRALARLSLPNSFGRNAPGQNLSTPISAGPSFHPVARPEIAQIPPEELLSIIRAQVEYYFSEENLAKDFFLRKNMDSQGFVPLRVIANFPRMKDLTPDPEFIRIACGNSETIDYVIGMEDNIERLRARAKWDTFVIPAFDDRLEDARNDGPLRIVWRSMHSQHLNEYNIPMFQPQYMNASPATYSMPNGFAEGDMYTQPFSGPSYPRNVENGFVNGHENNAAPKTSLSPSVADFSPNGTTKPFAPIIDGQMESANTFPDQHAGNAQLFGPSSETSPHLSAGKSEAQPVLVNGSSLNGASHSSHSRSSSQLVNGLPVGLGLIDDSTRYVG
jgi:hypothetical protein